MRLLILGTGTGVGKTFVAEALVRSLGVPTLALKPIESAATAELRDAERLQRASGASSPEPAPYHFGGELSPHLLARRSGQRISIERVAIWVQGCERAVRARATLIESAGGVFTPLADDLDNFDLAQALDPARWILVAENRLGVLHDVRAVHLAMQARGRTPDCIVVNRFRGSDESTSSNTAELSRFVSAPVLGVEPDRPDAVVAWARRELEATPREKS